MNIFRTMEIPRERVKDIVSNSVLACSQDSQQIRMCTRSANGERSKFESIKLSPSGNDKPHSDFSFQTERWYFNVQRVECYFLRQVHVGSFHVRRIIIEDLEIGSVSWQSQRKKG